MYPIMQILGITLVALAMAPALAHAFEFPGKMRLTRDLYVAVQSVYYPGFTIAGGIGEFGGLIATLILLLLTPSGTTEFYLTLIALLGLVAMQAVYWIRVHPVNQFWLSGAGTTLSHAGAGFFAFNPAGPAASDWEKLRDRWEYSHIARAALAFLSFLALLIAAVVGDSAA